MSKAAIINSRINGSKNGINDILIPRYEKGNYEYEIEFSGGKCPKKSSIKESLIEIFDGDKIIDSVEVKTNSKAKGKLNILVCISAFDNFSNSIHKIIDSYIEVFVGIHNESSVTVNQAS